MACDDAPSGIDRRSACRLLATGAGAALGAGLLAGCRGGTPAPLCATSAPGTSACGGTSLGPVTAIPLGRALLAHDACGNPFFVARDAAGVYALTAVCSHSGCTVGSEGLSQGFFCNCHGATFDADGNVTSGPAPFALSHYPCTQVGGSLCVDTSQTVPAETRLAVGADPEGGPPDSGTTG